MTFGTLHDRALGLVCGFDAGRLAVQGSGVLRVARGRRASLRRLVDGTPGRRARCRLDRRIHHVRRRVRRLPQTRRRGGAPSAALARHHRHPGRCRHDDGDHVGWLDEVYLASVTLTVVAGELPVRCLSRPAVWLWVAVQSVALGLIFWVSFGWVSGVSGGAAYAGFQVLALGRTWMELRERQARQQLARANAELRATRAVLAESSRVAEQAQDLPRPPRLGGTPSDRAGPAAGSDSRAGSTARWQIGSGSAMRLHGCSLPTCGAWHWSVTFAAGRRSSCRPRSRRWQPTTLPLLGSTSWCRTSLHVDTPAQANAPAALRPGGGRERRQAWQRAECLDQESNRAKGESSSVEPTTATERRL